MDTIGTSGLWTFFDEKKKCSVVKNQQDIRKGNGHHVKSYLELAGKVAELQYRNRDQVLLFRGQNEDKKNGQHNSTLKPNMFRAFEGKKPDDKTLGLRFERLKAAEAELVNLFHEFEKGDLGKGRIKQHRIMRWAILQHYGVCCTPLLDVTHSLRIAASFASLRSRGSKAFLYVLGVPYLGGAVTVSAEVGLQIVRLSSMCPPKALRPHIQEGYLLGEYPEIGSLDQTRIYEDHEIDFGRRLVAKFVFNPVKFWKDPAFPRVGASALNPSIGKDKMFKAVKPFSEKYRCKT